MALPHGFLCSPWRSLAKPCIMTMTHRRHQGMGNTARIDIDEPGLLTLEEFLATPKILFGPAWRYELHDGVVVAQAGPSDRHAIILGNLATMLGNQTIDSRDCTLFDGGAVVPRGKKRANARVPDA